MADLERSLTALGRDLAYPEAPGLAAAVRSRIASGPVTSLESRRSLRPVPSPRRALALAAAVVVILATTAVALRFALRGVEIRIGGTPPATRPPATASPSPTPSPAPSAALLLGERVSLKEARDRMPFPIFVPGLPGRPDQVWVDDEPSGGRVTFVYEPAPGLPADPHTGVGALLTQFMAQPDERFIVKQGGPDTVVEPVAVRGRPGYWITGEPHNLLYTDRAGGNFGDEVRLAGNVLLWQAGEVTLRLEADVPKDLAMRMAQS